LRELLLSQHRVLQTQLDALIAAVKANADYLDILTKTEELLDEHYAAEKPLLEKLKKHAPKLSAKMTSQHNEVLEIGGHLDNAIDRSQHEDALRLVKRFHALAQHNILEEERVMFQAAARDFEY
jgi:hypothetical protein